MSIDLSNVKSNNFETVPAGEYLVNVTNAEMKDTKSGDGKYIKAELTITQGAQEGRRLFTNFNIQNKSEKAQEIGLSSLRSLLEKAGYANPNSLESVTALCGLRVGVKTKIRTQEGYGDTAEVHYFLEPSKVATAKAEDNILF